MKRLQRHVDELEAAVDRIRRMHPRGEDESSALAPGLWCPGCGEPRTDNGFGACRTRRVLEGDADPRIRRRRRRRPA